MGKFQLFSRKTHISHHIARLTSSIMPTLGIIDASIILHSLIALLHCMDFLDNMVGGVATVEPTIILFGILLTIFSENNGGNIWIFRLIFVPL